METITLNKEQQRRAAVLTRLCAGQITKDDAQTLLNRSRRQVNRLMNDFLARGVESLLHGNSGKTPVNKVSEQCQKKILELAGENGKYHGFNTCHLSELLKEYENISIGRSTLHRLLLEQKVIKQDKQKPQQRRKRRQRASQEGLMVQIDGSSHDWLCGRGPKMTLIGGIDDATGKVICPVFRPTEDQAGYLMFLRSMAQSYGLPESLYHDKHTILRSPKEPTIEEELDGKEPQSQLQRVMSELGIGSIPAHSPQAKGRIERLWQTFQDRLIKEMTLAGVSTLSEANAFLPGFIIRFNARFACEPRNPENAWVELSPDIDLDYYFSTCENRVVRKDHTFSWFGKAYQILPDSDCLVLTGQRVDVRVTPEGSLNLYFGKRKLQYKAAQPVKRISVTKPTSKQPKQVDPQADARRRGWLFHEHAA